MSKRHADETSDASTLAAYLRQIAKLPLLTTDEERSLGVRIRRGRDEAAVSQLVQSHLRCVVSCAKRYRGCGVSMLDLIHEGNLGLIEAARRFDPSRHVKFISEAAWWIRQSMVHAMSTGTHGSIPPKALATREPEAVDAQSHPMGSMRHTRRRDELADPLVQDHGGVGEGMRQRSDWHELADALYELGGKDQAVRLRFGFDTDDPAALQEVADRPLLSRDAIRQIEMRAKGKLQQLARLRSHLN